MDTNQSNSNWQDHLHMSKEDQILHHPFIITPNSSSSLLYPTFPLQTPQQIIPISKFNLEPNNLNPNIIAQEQEAEEEEEEPEEELGAMKEMMYKIAAMQPVDIDPATIRKPPKRRNVWISDDPQSVAARHRRERISEKIRILQRLVPGGTKMDTASMLEEAIRYVKFLKGQIRLLQQSINNNNNNQAYPQIQTQNANPWRSSS